jgi:hypothetical protein
MWILKGRFQNRFLRVGLSRCPISHRCFLLNFLDGRTRFADNSYRLFLQICGPSLGPQLSQVLEIGFVKTRERRRRGNPERPATPVDCGLPFGSQLPRPLMDWSVSEQGRISEQYIATAIR